MSLDHEILLVHKDLWSLRHLAYWVTGCMAWMQDWLGVVELARVLAPDVIVLASFRGHKVHLLGDYVGLLLVAGDGWA